MQVQLRWICIVWSVFSWKPWTGEILRERQSIDCCAVCRSEDTQRCAQSVTCADRQTAHNISAVFSTSVVAPSVVLAVQCLCTIHMSLILLWMKAETEMQLKIAFSEPCASMSPLRLWYVNFWLIISRILVKSGCRI